MCADSYKDVDLSNVIVTTLVTLQLLTGVSRGCSDAVSGFRSLADEGGALPGCFCVPLLAACLVTGPLDLSPKFYK